MDEYLKVCQACRRRKPARYFRKVHGLRICHQCADFMEGGQYKPQVISSPLPKAEPWEPGQPPARWSERRRQ